MNAILNSATNTSGSGIDVTSTVDAILELDAAPEETLDAQVTSLNTQTTALQSLQSDIDGFSDQPPVPHRFHRGFRGVDGKFLEQ